MNKGFDVEIRCRTQTDCPVLDTCYRHSANRGQSHKLRKYHKFEWNADGCAGYVNIYIASKSNPMSIP